MSLIIRNLYEFGEFRLDPKEKIFMRGEHSITLTPKCFELLSALVESHGRLLTKDELMEKIWADSFVEESNLTFNIRQLRKILEDDAQNPTYIKTVRQHGYRFIAEVKEIVEQKSPTIVVEENTPAKIDEKYPPAQQLDEHFPSKQLEQNSNPPLGTPSKPFLRSFSKSYWLIAATAVLLITSVAIAFILNNNGTLFGNNAPILQANFRSEKLTATGGVLHAIISPDGKRMAYSSEINGKQGLWIRQLETSENIQILANSDDFYFGLAFSHDGESLYFSRGKGDKVQIIYRILIFGGIPKEIVSNTEGWFSLSPDDNQISFVRCPYQEEDYCSLYIADTDGKNERKILTRARPIRIGDNKFSPDGKSIAVALGQSRSGSQEFSLIEVDVNTGKEREITDQKFFDIKYITWLSDKSGLLFTGYERFYRPTKIYQVSNLTGEVQTLTNDSNNYNHISLDNSFQKMIATQFFSDFRLWVAPTDNPDSANPISYASGKSVFTPSGKLVYSSITDGNFNIWTINSDGTNQRQLTSNQGANLDPRVSPDERFIYFTSNRSGSKQVWRMDMDGSNQIQVSEGEGGTPIFVSTDGNTVFYVTALNTNLGKITTNSEGASVSSIISKERMLEPEFNSSGDIVAYFSRNSDENHEITLMSVTDGKILKTFELAEKKLQQFKLFWANSSKSVFYITGDDLKTNIWRVSLESGKSEKFTEFSNDDEIADFSFSPDGKTFAYIRGKWRHDAVLIEGLK